MTTLTNFDARLSLHPRVRRPLVDRALLAIADWSAWVRQSLAEHARQRRAERALRCLSDRSLRDLGLHRTQIPALLRGIDTDTLRRRNDL